jgi:hypothetical protein
MTGLQGLKQATKMMIATQGEQATVSLKTLLKLIEKAQED